MNDYTHLEKQFEYLPREFRLILECLKSKMNNREANNCPGLIDQDFDWEFFIDSVVYHGVYPMIYDFLKTLKSYKIPDKIFSRLQILYKKSILDSINLTTELSHLVKLFDKYKIRVISLKGPALAKIIYSNVHLRTSSDLDLLVDADDMETIEQILFKEGYGVLKRKKNLTRKEHAFFKKSTHHYVYSHNDTNIPIEIHWRLNKHKTGFFSESHFHRLWEEREIVTIKGTPVPTLSTIDNCLYLMVHGAYHQWVNLRWLYDITILLHNSPQLTVEALMDYAGRFELQTIVGQTLILSKIIFGNDLVDNLEAVFKTDRSIRLCKMIIPVLPTNLNPSKIKPFSRELYQHILYTIILLNSNKNRLQYIFQHFRPTVIDYQTFYLPDRFFPLYYILRPFLLLIRQFKSQS